MTMEFIDPAKAITDCEVNYGDLNSEFVRQPGLIYHYASLQAQAERQHSELKLRLELTKAKVSSNVRAEATASGEKLTAAMVEERAGLHPQTVKVAQQLIAAKEVFDSVKAVVEGIRHKKDMLVIAGNTNRDEMKAKIELRDSLVHRDTYGVRDHAEAIKERMGKNS